MTIKKIAPRRPTATGCGPAPASTKPAKPAVTPGPQTSWKFPTTGLSERARRQLAQTAPKRPAPVSTGCGGPSVPAKPSKPAAKPAKPAAKPAIGAKPAKPAKSAADAKPAAPKKPSAPIRTGC